MPKREHRAPPLAIQLDQLEEGDVLLFMPSVEECRVQQAIEIGQAATNLGSARGGHFDCTHAAICIGYDEQKQALLGHIAPQGFVREPLVKYDGDQRAFMVFRRYDKSSRQQIAELARAESNVGIKWDFLVALTTLVKWPQLATDRKVATLQKPVSRKTICSKFVTEILKNAARKRGDKEDIISTISPKSLESYLYHNENFQMFTYLGKEPYKTFQKEIESTLKKINKPEAQLIYDDIARAINQEMQLNNEMYKLLSLLHVMIPVLKQYSMHAQICNMARKRAIFDRDIYNTTVEKVTDIRQHRLEGWRRR